MKILETENLTKTYHIGSVEVRALQGVSISIEAGEFTAIMGASGSGKSTLMHLLGFLDAADQGTIRLMGKDITHLSEEERAYLRNGVVGFIFQQFNLMSRSTALENVALPLLYSENHSHDMQRPAELLEQVGLGNRIEHKPNELSGGQQQRVAIARALVNNPLLILADEPTGNLDSRSGVEIMNIFKDLHQKGMTIVIVTHDEKIGQVCDRVIRMQDGKVLSDEKKEKPKNAADIIPKLPFDTIPKSTYSFKEFREHFNQAIRMISSNKLRSFLSILGVLIGVACVITMLALGRGAQEAVKQELAKLGSNLLAVRPGASNVGGVRLEAGAVTRLSLEDAKAIRETIPSVKRVAPTVRGQAQLVYEDKNWSTQVQGTTAEYADMRDQNPIMGRFFTAKENANRARVVLIGQTVMRELFGSQNPVGKTMKVNRINFQVIGVLPNQASSGGWRDQDDLIMIPLLTAMRRVFGKQYIDDMNVEIATADEIGPAQDEIELLLSKLHRLPPSRNGNFTIRSFADAQQAMENTSKTFSVLLGCVAAISLLVGGIGIMNIMLVSVKERTREIGLRKAIGATPRDILIQFLVEAVVITFLGGFVGIVLAGIISWLISTLVGWKMVITVSSLLLAFIFSAMVGIIFGAWPAKQASELEPIQSLRYE